MLVHEKELKELLLSEAHNDEPGRSDHTKEQECFYGEHIPEEKESLFRPEEEDNCDHQKDKSYRPLGQDGQRKGGKEEVKE